MIKRLIIVYIGILSIIPVQLQARKYFCEIKGIQKELTSGLKIVFDFGESQVYSIWGGLNNKQKLVDENGKGKPLTQVLATPKLSWYEMLPNEVVPIFTMMNPDARIFFGRFEKPSFINQRLIGFKPKNENVDVELCHALINSVLMKFFVEAVGFGRGLGVLDINKDAIASCYMLDPDKLSSSKKDVIKNAFKKILVKKIDTVESELSDPEWVKFNKAVLEAYGIEKYYEQIVKSLRSLRKIRHTVKE